MYMNCHPIPFSATKFWRSSILIPQHIRHPSSLTVKRTQPSPANATSHRLFSRLHSWQSIPTHCPLFTIRLVNEMAEVDENADYENQEFAQSWALPTRPTKTSFNTTSLNVSYSDIEVCVDESLSKHQNLLKSSQRPQIPRKLCPKFYQIRKIDMLGASNDGKGCMKVYSPRPTQVQQIYSCVCLLLQPHHHLFVNTFTNQFTAHSRSAFMW